MQVFQVDLALWPWLGTRSSTIFGGQVDMIGVLSPRAYALVGEDRCLGLLRWLGWMS